MPRRKRRTFASYVNEFIRDSRSVGLLLFTCTFLSLLVANLSFGEMYTGLINKQSALLHTFGLPNSLVHFINDGLMTIFFFLAGMEIKRELLTGELATIKQALLPGAAAVGGMLLPALIFLIITKGQPYQHGWGIPMATDIAFSLGVASMLGKRFPVSLKIFLTALAIIDDLGAIMVIAFFYGEGINFYFLGGAVAIITSLALLHHFKVPFGIFNFMLGILLWYCVFNSGIHATIAGVAFAFMVPAGKLQHYEHTIHKLVNFVILPVFALVNTAILVPQNMLHLVSSRLSLGIIAGLFLGKPIGIFLACRFMVRKKFAQLPAGTTWGQVWGVGLLAGIGFTMSIFITTLAFNSPLQQDIAKVAILLSLVLSVIATFFWMTAQQKRKNTIKVKARTTNKIKGI